MADNTTLNAMSGGDVIASDDIGGVKYQRVKMSVGADGSATDVSSAAPLPVTGTQDSRTTGTITSGTSTVGPVAATNRNLATVDISGTYAGVTFVIEGSTDGGTAYYPIQAINNGTGRSGATWTQASNESASFDLAIGAFTHIRVRATAWTSGTANVGITLQTFAYDPVVSAVIDYPQRTNLCFYAVAAAAGASGTQTAITLTKSADTAATSSAASFVVTAGKRFRITHLSVATRGHSTATAQTTTFNLRINTSGAVTTTSTPIVFSARTATPSTANSWDRYSIPLPEGGYEIAGTGSLQFGMTAVATYTTNAPTWDVTIFGYEY